LQYGKENSFSFIHSCHVWSVTRNNNPNKFNYTFHSHRLKSIEETKYLCLNNQTIFNLENYVNNDSTKANKTLETLKSGASEG